MGRPTGRGRSEPVVVAGAGPVGLCTALLLARWGVPTVVLEARLGHADVGSRAICMQRDALEILERAGCGRAMAAEGVTWTVGRTYYREHELFTTTFPPAPAGALPPWVNISQSRTERHLLLRAARCDLIDLRYGHRVSGVRQDGSGVEVDVVVDAAAGPAGAAGGTRTVRGSHLVAADGAHSAVRDLLGIAFPGHSYADRFLICDIRADLPFPNERRFYFDPRWNPGRQVLVHQCPDSTWRIDWQVPVDYTLDAERRSGALDARIRRITGELPYEIVWLTVYRFHERCAQRFADGRVFLAGDAAHLFAPFGARGLNSGIADADNLAWKLGLVRAGLAGPALLGSYDTERRAAAAENLRVTDSTMRFLAPRTEREWARRRDTLDRALTDPAARAEIDSGKLAEPFWYLDSPLTTPGPPAPDFPTGAGATRPPVAGVLCPDGPAAVPGRPEVTRLRDLVGTALLVLTARGDRTAPAAAAAGAGGAPVEVRAIADLDPGGGLAAALAAGPDSVHVVRPDGHLAAVLPGFDPAALSAALRRACGHPATG